MKTLSKNEYTTNLIETFKDNFYFYIFMTYEGAMNLEKFFKQNQLLTVRYSFYLSGYI